MSSRAAADTSLNDGRSSGTSRAGSIASSPIAMNTTSGSSFPIVSTLTTVLLCRIPRTLIAAIARMMTAITRARRQPEVRAGQYRPIESTSTFTTAAQLAVRVNHISHPTWNPGKRPNAVRV